MLKKSNKKGFTLAELLIVVAIIAVLTAIAVPLFVSSINDAQDATFAANQNTLRSTAVVSILESGKADELFKESKKVYAGAIVSKNGDISGLEIVSVNSLTTGSFKGDKLKALNPTKVTESYKDWQDNSNAIIIEITKIDFDGVISLGE